MLGPAHYLTEISWLHDRHYVTTGKYDHALVSVLVTLCVGERPHRIDRMWTHLRLAGVFERVAGLALDDFTDGEDPDGAFTLPMCVWGLAAEVGVPCLGALPIGHDAINVPVALGTRVRLDGGAGTLSFLEPAVGG